MSEIETPPAAAPEEGVDDRYQWPEDVDPEIAGRYKTPGDLARGKREADALVQRTTQEAADLRRQVEQYEAAKAEAEQNQPWVDPLQAQLEQEIDPAMARRLESAFMRNPAEAYDLAVEAAPGYGPGLSTRVLSAWMQQDPKAAMMHTMMQEWSNVMDERFQSFEDALSERLGPTLAHATTQISDASIERARGLAPDFGQYEERIEQMLNPDLGGNPQLIADVMGNVQGTADRLLQLRDLLWAQDERQKQIQAGLPPTATPAEAPKSRPRQATIANGNAARPSGSEEEYAQQLKDSMKGVKARVL